MAMCTPGQWQCVLLANGNMAKDRNAIGQVFHIAIGQVFTMSLVRCSRCHWSDVHIAISQVCHIVIGQVFHTAIDHKFKLPGNKYAKFNQTWLGWALF
jgi:hypothetical protein